MKSNKTCKFVQKIKNANINFGKSFKYFVIAPLAIILAGIILFCTVGFNQGIDFTGGTIANVYIGETLTQQAVYDDAVKKIDQVLSDNNLKASVYQTSENNMGLSISVRYKDIKGKTEDEMNEINKQVVDQLFQTFGYDQNDNIEKNYISGNQRISASVGQTMIINVFASVVIASLVTLLYFFIRFGITSGMTALLCVYHDILIMLALVLACRFEVNSSLIAGVVAVLGYSFVNNVLFFDDVRNNIKEQVAVKNSDIANISVRTNLLRSILVTSIIVGTLVIFGCIGIGDIASFAFPVCFGVLASFYSSNFLSPALWSFAYIKKDKAKKEPTDKITI